jgi:hypothetical protein
MPRKSYKPEKIVAKLRQVDVLTSQGQSVAEAIRTIGVSEDEARVGEKGRPANVWWQRAILRAAGATSATARPGSPARCYPARRHRQC